MKTFQVLPIILSGYLSRKIVFVWLLLFALLFVFPLPAKSQDISATAEVDTNAILIGGQFTFSLRLEHPTAMRVEWPMIPDTFSLFEKVKSSPVDTVVNGTNKSITRSQHFKFTSFDSGFHVIPPFEFLYRLPGDTAFQKAATEPILINVQTIPVDTTRAFKDIKGQIVIPFSWRDLVPYFIALIIIALVIFMVYFLIRKFKKVKKPVMVREPWRPADEIALEALQRLEEAKLWQQGNYKAYFTGLSDSIRTFIDNRWSVNAMEMTTDEILRMTLISHQDPETLMQLKNLLELADLVKFAKVIPVLNENEQSMRYAVAFVKANRQTTEVKEVAI